jgi:sulfate adenylyltransferase subunit 2
VWRHIRAQSLKVVPLYFAQNRPVVIRNGQLFLYDDERFPLEFGEQPLIRKVRFRTLGCYPLTAGIESKAESVDDLIYELENDRFSERAGRLIDFDES